ncbi:AAA family ATPase [Patescibacteria group bacterium]
MAKSKKRGKLIWATGLPGCERKEYLKRLVKLCKKNGKKIKIYNIGDRMFEIAKKTDIPITIEKVLDSPPHTINPTRAAALEGPLAKREIDLAENDIVMYILHTRYVWEGEWIPAYNIHYMKKFDPDMFISFIDSADKILQRLKDRDQWSDQDLSETLIWHWQNEEVNNTETYKYLFGEEKKPFYVIPVLQPEETLYHLIFEPWRPRVYAMMPISHLDEKELKKVTRFIKWLENYFIVFNPLTIDINYTKPVTETDRRTREHQTVIRDLYWHIGQSEMCIAYFVRLVFTAGVVIETKHARDTNKDVYWIFPKEPGPFEKRYVKPTQIFKALAEFKQYVISDILPIIEQRKQKYLTQNKI